MLNRATLIISGILLLLFCFVQKGVAQNEEDTSRNSRSLTYNVIYEGFVEKKERDPKKAIWYSVFLPGAGQVYNRQYYKVPILYAGFGGMLYAVDWNKTQYERFKDAYSDRLNGIPVDDIPDNVPDESIRNARDQYRKNMELSYIGLGLVYFLNITDAFVSAHLSTFDIDDNLSFSILPSTFKTALGTPVNGIGLYIEF